ncbi:MAG TPA: PAS domain-containing protein [Desulfurivibrionaceae bacterium]
MLDTPRAIPLNLLHQLFTPLCDDICCGLFVVEILRDGAGDPRGFVGRVANQLFCELLSVSENDILDTELPESLCQALTLSALLHDLPISGATRICRELSLGPDRSYTLQAHLPCPELLTIAIQNAQPDRTMISCQAEAILASLGEPCTIIDRNFSILYENEAARKIWGSNCKKSCYTAYHGLQSRCESCHATEVFIDGKIHKNEKLSHLNGNDRHLEITSAPLRDATGEITAVVNIIRDVTIRKMTEKGKEHLIRELQASLAKTKRLNGLLPICSYCKKIKDDNGVWQQLESYLRSHAEVEFSHGICQECGEKHHPQVFRRR